MGNLFLSSFFSSWQVLILVSSFFVSFQLCHLCTVPLSLFADPERILRRLYVFAEEPCKSTTTTSEPCSPVFKEVQPRPSEHSNLEYHINNLNLYLYVFGLFIIFVIKAIQPDCDKIKGISVLLLETPLTRSKYFSPYTHAQHRMRTSRTFYTFAYKLPLHLFFS